MQLKAILGNTAWLGLLQVANYALPLLAVPVVTRALGPGLFGVVASLSALAAYVGLVISYGFGATGGRVVARNRENLAELSQAVSAILTLQLLITLITGAVFVVLIFTMSLAHSREAAAFLILLNTVATALTPIWLFTGLERMRDVVLPQLASRVLSTAAIILLVRGPQDLTLYTGITAAASVLNLGLFVLLARSIGIRYQRPTRATGRGMMGEAFPVFASNVAVMAYTTSNVLIVSLMLGTVAAGIFALADRIRTAALGIFMPLTQAIYPFVCRTVGSGDAADQLVKRRFFQIMIASSVAVAVLLYAFAPLAVRFLGGAQYLEAVTLTRIFALVPFAIILSNILGIQIMLPLGMDRQLGTITIGSALVGVALQVLLTSHLGLIGSALAYLLTEIGVSGVMYVTLRRVHPEAARGWLFA